MLGLLSHKPMNVMFNLSCFSCVSESVGSFPMVNVWAGESAMCRVATECAGTWRGCAVVVCEFRTNE